MKRAAIAFIILLAYQTAATLLLYTSSYFNIISYYTNPPTKGNIELQRMPLLFGDSIALYILGIKQQEAKILVQEGNIGLAAVLASYEHNQALPLEVAKRRAFKIADFFIAAGYDTTRCEDSGRSTAQVLKDWEILDEDMQKCLRQHNSSDDIFDCKVPDTPSFIGNNS